MYILSFIKILRNKWLFIALVFCVFLFITAACMLPMFQNALVGRMLTMSFKDSTLKDNNYSNHCTYIIPMYTDDKKAELSKYYSNLIENELVHEFKQPIAFFNKFYYSTSFDLTDITYQTDQPNIISNAFFMSMNNTQNNIELLHGVMPSAIHKDYIEVIISNDTANSNDMVIGRIYSAKSPDVESSVNDVKIKVVGIFNPVIGSASSLKDEYYSSYALISNTETFNDYFTDKNGLLRFISWDFLLDYSSINATDIPSIIDAYDKQSSQFSHVYQVSTDAPFSYNGIDIIKKYNTDRFSLNLMILLFTIPMFLLLIYCTFFISKLIVEMDKNEISVLQSRGASLLQIAGMYFLQSFVLIILPLLSAPFIAGAACRILGNTTSFLEFGSNIALKPLITWQVLIFDFLAGFLIIVTILIPCLLNARITIVERKQAIKNENRQPFWKRFYLDVILIVLSGYGYYTFASRQKIIVDLEVNPEQIPIDPITFIIMVMFLTALGLLFIRIYPLIVKLITNIGRRFWNAPLYSALQRTVAMGVKEQFVILFIIASLSLGIFSANSAQTVNRNLNDYIMYGGGTDMVLIPLQTIDIDPAQINSKPPAGFYSDLQGVKNVSVISTAINPQIYANSSQNSDPVIIKGIDVSSFYDVAWSRTDMLDKNIVEYLNLLQQSADSCLISQSLANKMGLETGDSILVNQNDRGYDAFEIKINAIIKAWPSYNYKKNDVGKLFIDDIIITNTDFIEKKFGDLSYEVWLKTDRNASSASITSQLSENLNSPSSVHDYKNDVRDSENSAQRQSLNTLLTLSFIIVFAICFAGYLIYWILSLKARRFQIGVLRAMGLSIKSIYAMFIGEQILIAIIPAVFSVIAGGIISRLFVNLLKVTFGADSQLIPFNFVSSQSDFVKIYIFFAVMFIINLAVMVLYIKKIDIGQTIKLGED